jgi:hypothetical protein
MRGNLWVVEGITILSIPSSPLRGSPEYEFTLKGEGGMRVII